MRTHLDGREGGDYGRRSEAVRDEAEVGEVPLDRWVQNLLRPRVAERRAVLVQQVHQLLCDNSARRSDRMPNLSSGHGNRRNQSITICTEPMGNGRAGATEVKPSAKLQNEL